ncbi:MAG TPA: heme ABC transporter permease [Micropepsaceae bacterium]|nr:heme ABC transporter permease [Micropepsaceae bacterium]
MIQRFANPKRFDAIARRVAPVMAVAAAACLAWGVWLALFDSPPDFRQGDTVRIMYVHVPAAWMASAVYVLIAVASAVSLIFRHPLADVAARAAAPFGLAFTFLALVTGSLWGKPMWGTWWVWDARLTSVLVLFFLYAGYIAVWQAMEDTQKAARAAAILALAGSVNIPIIRFSVDWWNSLHQPASVFRAEGPTIDSSMLWPLGVMALAYTFLFAALWLYAIRTEIAARRARTLAMMVASRDEAADGTGEARHA